MNDARMDHGSVDMMMWDLMSSGVRLTFQGHG